MKHEIVNEIIKIISILLRLCVLNSLWHISIKKSELIINIIKGIIFNLSHIFSKIETHALYCASLDVSWR